MIRHHRHTLAMLTKLSSVNALPLSLRQHHCTCSERIHCLSAVHLQQRAEPLYAQSSSQVRHCIAGIIEGNTTISATSETLYDVTMPELALVLLPQLQPKSPKFDERSPKWLRKQQAAWLERQKKRLHCLIGSAACQQRPWKAIADAAVQHGNSQEWQVEQHS